jgi:metacaspase-1
LGVKDSSEGLEWCLKGVRALAKTALCIGINNYPGTGSDLAGCVNDAKDWRDALEDKGFSTQLMLDGDAKKAPMKDAITDIVNKAHGGDVVVITYSGHGSWVIDKDNDEPDNRDEVLCPHDIGQNRPFRDDELHEIFSDRERGVHITLISDSCHSGSVARLAPASQEAENPQRVRFLPPSTFLPDEDRAAAARVGPAMISRKRHAAVLVSGCQDTEFSYDAWFGGRPNGAFSYFALKTLGNLPNNATYRDWYRKIRDKLPSQQYPQTPNLGATHRMRDRQIFE